MASLNTPQPQVTSNITLATYRELPTVSPWLIEPAVRVVVGGGSVEHRTRRVVGRHVVTGRVVRSDLQLHSEPDDQSSSPEYDLYLTWSELPEIMLLVELGETSDEGSEP